MAEDLFHALSTNELKKEINALVAKDKRTLPENSKIFAAVAQLQKFDQLPDLVGYKELSGLIAAGDVELNRGLTATKGIPVALFVRELLTGAMYPGTLSSIGNGIYLATTQPPKGTLPEAFPTLSEIAMKYATNDEPGMIVRCALKKGSKRVEYDDLHAFCRENRNRASKAGIKDFGAIAAALGFDAYVRDNIEAGIAERVWVVVNRNALTFQREVLQYARPVVG